jgi:hypothetical protein
MLRRTHDHPAAVVCALVCACFVWPASLSPVSATPDLSARMLLAVGGFAVAAPMPQDKRQAATAVQAPSPPLALTTLAQRLRETDAIGVFTKMELKFEIDELLDALRAYHHGQREPSLEQLHERYNLLLLKVVTLLQADDPALARDIGASRAALWDLLSAPETFKQ